jgi:hypothetical protein
MHGKLLPFDPRMLPYTLLYTPQYIDAVIGSAVMAWSFAYDAYFDIAIAFGRRSKAGPKLM